MIYLDRCPGEVIPYYFSFGSAIDMARTATRQAYLASLDRAARDAVLKVLENGSSSVWPAVKASVENAVREVKERVSAW